MGMYLECQNELIRALHEAECPGTPFLSKKKLELSQESRISAVLCEEDRLERASGKKIFTTQEGTRSKRSKRYSREIIYSVVIGDYSQEKAEETYQKFLLSLATGIYVDGNYVSIEPADAQWMGEKDHILNAKVAVQLKVICSGGLYSDTGMLQLKDAVVDVEKGE